MCGKETDAKGLELIGVGQADKHFLLEHRGLLTKMTSEVMFSSKHHV